ncbi:MAG: RnfH family protein [Casimicrobiaceae bacterium]
MSIDVVVAYAAPGIEDIVVVRLDHGACVADAVRRSGIVGRRQLRTLGLEWAIFGHAVAATTVLADGDRIEVTRPLAAAPMAARRRRAATTPAASKRRAAKPGP